jgi:transposase
MKNWRKEILNYFDHPITNVYTEAVNGVVKVENRMGRGYSFEVIRARILFSDKAPSARLLRAKVAIQPKARKMARCEWCLGLFTQVDRHESGGRIFTVCANCHRR